MTRKSIEVVVSTKHNIKMKLTILLSFLLLLWGCKKEKIVIDNQVHIEGMNPSFALPLADISMNLGNIAASDESDNFFYSDEDEVFALSFKKDLFTYGIDDILTFPSQVNTVTFNTDEVITSSLNLLSTGNQISYPINTSSDFGFSNGEALDEINVSQGQINLNLQTDLKQDVQIEITFPTVTSDNNPLVYTQSLSYNGSIPVTANDIVSLANYSIGFNDDGNSIPIEVVITIVKTNELVNVGESIVLENSFQIDQISSVFGYFGQQNNLLDISNQPFNPFPNLVSNSIYFANPRINFIFSNSTGVDLALNVNNIQVMSNSNVINIGGSDVSNFPTITGASTPGEVVFTTHSITNAGSSPSVSDLLALESANIQYTTTATVNPTGIADNFLLDSSKIKCTTELLIPLYLRAENFIFSDSIDLDLTKIFGNQEADSSTFNIDNVKQITLRMTIENGFPLDISANVYFANEDYVILDSLWDENSYEQIFESGLVDFSLPEIDTNYGRVTTPTTTVTDIVINQERLKELIDNGSKKLIIRTVGNTLGSSNGELVKFFPEYSINAKIKAKVDFNFDAN